MRLEDLQYFLETARHGHVGRAADELGVTQPALTKGIQRLESELGIRLFERTPRGMRLTTPGEALFERFSSVVLQIEDAVREASDMHHGSLGMVRVGVTPLLAEGFLNPCTIDLMAQRPAARVVLNVNLHDALLPALSRGELDLVVSSLHESAEPLGLQTRALFADDLHVAARRGHPLFDKSRVQAKDLVSYGWVLPGGKIGASQWLRGKFQSLGLPEPSVVVQSNTTVNNLMSIIHQTDLLTLVSAMTLSTRDGSGLSVIDLEALTWHRQIGLYLRKDAYLSPLVQRLIEIIDISASERRARG